MKSIRVMLATMFAFVSALFAPMAHAALDTAVTTELTNAKTDVLALGALVFAIVVAVAIYKWFRRAV